MHHHNVYFWLKEELSTADLLDFENGLETLTRTAKVISGSFGKPANTSRPVIDSTYSYGLLLTFKDTTDQDNYQSDPIHLAFVNQHSAKWTRVIVYDVEVK
jgi:hypothetical protein